MRYILSRFKLGGVKTVKYTGLLILVVSIVLITLTLLSTGYIVVESKWIKKIGYGEEPVDISTSNGYVYVLTVKGVNVIITKIMGDSGEILWRTIWSANENVTINPLKVLLSRNGILVPVLYGDRHTLLILNYGFDGVLLNKTLIKLKKNLEWIYDVDIYDGYLVIVGARYKAGDRLQYLLKYYELSSGKIVWSNIWGSRDIDYLFRVCVSPGNGIIYALGNSTITGYTIYSISPQGKILWSYKLGVNIHDVPSIYCYSDRIYLLILHKEASPEILVLSALKPVVLQSEVVAIAGLNDFLLGSLSVSRTYIVLSGTGYNPEDSSYDALVYVRSLMSEKSKIIWFSGKGVDVSIKSIIRESDSERNTIYSLSLMNNYIVVACYNVYPASINLIHTMLLSITGLIGAYIFLRHRRS